jgi:hypothetical protein
LRGRDVGVGRRYPAMNDCEARARNFGRCRVLVRNLGRLDVYTNLAMFTIFFCFE